MNPRHEGGEGPALTRAVWGLAAVTVAIYVAWFHGLRHDDAYVTFRYARNLALGQGFAFNPGEAVLGTTSPLFALLLAPVFALLGDVIAPGAVVLSACALGAQAMLLHTLLRRELPRTSVVVALAVALGLADSVSWLALETHLAFALGLGSYVCARASRPLGAGTLLGLAFLARHDMALWGPWLLLALGAGRTETRPALRMLGPALGIALGWLLFAFVYFGDPLPHTLGAKLHSTQPLEYLLHYLDLFSRVPGFASLPRAARLALLAVLLGRGIRLAVGPVPALRPLLGFALSLLCAYTVLGPPASQHWHLYGATLGVRVTMLVGLLGSLELRRTDPRRGQILALGLGALLCVTLGAELWRRSNSFAEERWLGERHARYLQVARYVNAHTPAGASFMATEIGTLGYLTDRRMIDPFGLINWTNAWPRSMRPEDYMDLVRHFRPEVLLLDSPQAAESLAAYAPELRYRILRVFEWRFPFSTVAVLESSISAH